MLKMKHFLIVGVASCLILLLCAQSGFAAPNYVRLDKERAALVLVDHQTGLFSLVQDIEPALFKNNVIALAEVGKFFKLPTVISTSLEQGPNGPFLPEVVAIHPDVPIIQRPGQINAWDNPDFVEAIKKTGRKQLIIAGIVTDVCVAHVTLSAIEAGYEVFVVTDASGTFDVSVRDASWMRMSANGAQLLNWFSVACELMRDWRNDMPGLAALLAKYMPSYANLISSQNFTLENAKAK